MAIGAQKTQLSDHSDFLKLVAHFLEEQLKQCLYSRIVINVFYATVKSWFIVLKAIRNFMADSFTQVFSVNLPTC